MGPSPRETPTGGRVPHKEIHHGLRHRSMGSGDGHSQRCPATGNKWLKEMWNIFVLRKLDICTLYIFIYISRTV